MTAQQIRMESMRNQMLVNLDGLLDDISRLADTLPRDTAPPLDSARPADARPPKILEFRLPRRAIRVVSRRVRRDRARLLQQPVEPARGLRLRRQLGHLRLHRR